MKKLLTGASLLLCFFSFAQTARFNLTLKTDDKITIHGFSYWQEMHVRSKDTSFTYQLHRSNPDVIKNLKPGAYQLTAVSLFNHRISKKVQLKKKTPLVKIKGLQSFYQRADEKQTLSATLKENDTLFVLFNSNVDESIREKIAITKNKYGYKAIQYRGITSEVFQDMQFKDEFYKHVIKFEEEGKKANAPKGETAPKAEMYTLALNRKILSFIVPGEWGGMNQLKALLFLVEQK